MTVERPRQPGMEAVPCPSGDLACAAVPFAHVPGTTSPETSVGPGGTGVSVGGAPNGSVNREGRDGRATIRATGVTFRNGRIFGRLQANSAVSPISGDFGGPLVAP